MFHWFQRYFLKRRIIRDVEAKGFKVTSFEFLPEDATKPNSMSIIPEDDGFDHKDSGCLCFPVKKLIVGDNGVQTILIRHNDMLEKS